MPLAAEKPTVFGCSMNGSGCCVQKQRLMEARGQRKLDVT